MKSDSEGMKQQNLKFYFRRHFAEKGSRKRQGNGKANEQNQALEIRQMAMQTMAQTEKRSSDDQKALKQKHSKRSNIQKLWIF